MKLLADILGKAESVIRKLKNRIYRAGNPQLAALEQWYREDPRGLKRSEFEFLTPDSNVIDLGGYEGEWTAQLFSRYCCNIFIFEPVKAYAEIIAHRFHKNPRIRVFQKGLAPASSTALISINEFESKMLPAGSRDTNTETIELLSAQDFFTQQGLHTVDLVKINIEGAEFELLEHLIETGLISRIHTLLIQFHPWISNAPARRDAIRRQLQKDFELVFDYPFVWECWKQKD